MIEKDRTQEEVYGGNFAKDAPDFRSGLVDLLNKFSRENMSNTPDWILRNYLCSCLDTFDTAVQQRDRWYGIKPEPGVPHYAG